jgi:hypothetical protein
MNKKILISLGFAVLLIAGILIKTPLQNKPVLVVKYINQWPGFSIDSLEMLKDLLDEKYKIVNDQNTDNYDLVIDGVFGKEKIKNKHAIKVFFTGEAIKPRIDGYDLSIGYSYINSPNYIRIPLIYMEKGRGGKNISANNSRDKCNPNKPYFSCFLVSNGTAKSWLTGNEYDGVILRDRLFHQLSLYKRVESGGAHLNNRGEVLAKNKTKEFLSQCKFIIAYENQSFPGYITEKVFQAYDAGAIPIYYSGSEVAKDINVGAVVFAPNFADEVDLVKYIKQVDQDDKLYCDIWNKNLITDPTKNYDVVKEKFRKKLVEVFYNHGLKE